MEKIRRDNLTESGGRILKKTQNDFKHFEIISHLRYKQFLPGFQRQSLKSKQIIIS